MADALTRASRALTARAHGRRRMSTRRLCGAGTSLKQPEPRLANQSLSVSVAGCTVGQILLDQALRDDIAFGVAPDQHEKVVLVMR